MTIKRRLVLCLDGTWNNRDSSTNVLHHYSVAKEYIDKIIDGTTATQRTFYHEGVGTTPLDRITGGAFGRGIEENVRDAYNWLVQHYQDGDEVYIFGFSRGAYTARSLVGFISMCGLVLRGAPLTVKELWQNYCILGRVHEDRGGLWTSVFGEERPRFRPIHRLKWDPWLGGKPVDPTATLEEPERLVMDWSRRIKITYLGLYDTVGALGWDALAIPGIRSRVALHHNMRPTKIVQKCRHALALDEHRSNFNHTPFVAYVAARSAVDEDDSRSATSASGSGGEEWDQRIEQRWFVGAHSNVGGGYDSNLLAHLPLKWVIEGAQQKGGPDLDCEDVPNIQIKTGESAPKITDSFMEFGPIWTAVIRAKRHYRVIDPTPKLRAKRQQPDSDEPAPGYALASINEQLDPSVLARWRDAPPANLVCYAQRRTNASEVPAPDDPLAAIAQKPAPHQWIEPNAWSYLVLALWATGAAGGVAASDLIFRFWWPGVHPLWTLALAAAAFALIDWSESLVSFNLAQGDSSPGRRAFLDSIYWTRALAVGFFVIGAIFVLVASWILGWGRVSIRDAYAASEDWMWRWGLIAASAGGGVLTAALLDRLARGRARVRPALASLVGAPLLVVAVIAVLLFVSTGISRVATPAMRTGVSTASDTALTPDDAEALRVLGEKSLAPADTAPGSRLAGLVLLLQIGIGLLLNALSWAAESMQAANLSSITRLWFCQRPGAVSRCLDRWTSMLTVRPEKRAEARDVMSDLVRETLCRDMLGFIPLYSIVFSFGLWLGADQLGWEWLSSKRFPVPLWVAIPAIVAAANYGKDALTMRYLALHQRGAAPSVVTTLAVWLMTVVGVAAFWAQVAVCLGVVFAATGRLVAEPDAIGWRGLVASGITAVTVVAVVAIGVWAIVYRCLAAMRRDTSAAKRA